jgi:hypothetical protein
MMGTRIAVTITLAATSAVAEAATGSKAGLIWAIITGFATAAPRLKRRRRPPCRFLPDHAVGNNQRNTGDDDDGDTQHNTQQAGIKEPSG